MYVAFKFGIKYLMHTFTVIMYFTNIFTVIHNKIKIIKIVRFSYYLAMYPYLKMLHLCVLYLTV